MKTNPTPTSPLVDVIEAAIYKARWMDNFGKESVLATDEAIASAVLDALTKAGGVEWGVSWSNSTTAPIECVSESAAVLTSGTLAKISSDGNEPYPVQRLAGAWTPIYKTEGE